MDFNKITNSIFVGEKIKPEDLGTLRDCRINLVVNMMAEDNSEQDLIEDSGLEYKYIPVEDGFPLTLSELVFGSEFILKAVSSELKRVYIHCGYGVGRSPYMAAAVLMNLGMETYDALNFVTSKRLVTRISPWQEIALFNLEAYMQGETPEARTPDAESVAKFCKSRATWLRSVGRNPEADYMLQKINAKPIFVK